MTRAPEDDAGARFVWDDRKVRILGALTTPLLPDHFFSLVSPLRSARGLRGRIEEVRSETASAATLVIRAGRGWTPHRAGQWVRIGVQIDGVWHSRTYSVTSVADGCAQRFAITVKAVDGGRVSSHLVHRVRPGTIVQVEAPAGEFCLPDAALRPTLLLTAGSGITPVMAMLRTLTVRGGEPDVVHVHSSCTSADMIFGDELRARSRLVSTYRLLERHSDHQGLFQLGELDAVCPDWRERETWACGPAGLLDAIEKHWADAGLTASLHVERFEAQVFASPDAVGGSVDFRSAGRCVDAAGDQPLLEVGEAAGVIMPSGCRMGICYSCIAPLRSGQVRDLRTGEVHGDAGDLIQTCVSAAAGPCSIDL